MIIHNPILTGSFTVNGTDVASITSSAASLTSLNAYTASQNNRNGTYATTGSNTFAGIQTVNSNLVVTGSITAQTLVVQTVTSSVIYSSGSNVFGNDIANTQVFTGSVLITGSVGIGTSNPDSKLHIISDAAASTNNYALRLQNTTTAEDARVGIAFLDNANTGGSGSGATIQVSNNGINGTGNLLFGTLLNGTNTERMRINSSGSVGIGTTTPLSTLEIQGSSISTGLIYGHSSDTNYGSYLLGSGQGFSGLAGNTKPDGTVSVGASGTRIDFGGNGMQVYTSAETTGTRTWAEKMKVTIAGNVGIGGVTANYTLDVNKSVAADFIARILNSSSTGYGLYVQTNDNSKPGIRIANASGATKIDLLGTGAVTLTASDDGIGQYFWFTGNAAVSSNFSLYAYSNNVYFNAYQTMVIRANQGTTGGSIQLSGGVVYIGGASITNSGSTMNVIGTSTSLPLSRFFVNVASSLSVPAARFDKYDNNTTTSQVFLDFTVNNQASGNGSITANGASQATFTTWSDVRLKENITNLPSQLSNIMALRPVEFDYKNGSGHQIGFIAQEVQEIYPDIVGENAEGYLTISGLSKMESRLIKAIQELQAQITELKNK
jgi:hypothetical protein